MQNVMKIRPVEAEFHADGRTDVTKLTVAFRNFVKASKKTTTVTDINEKIFQQRHKYGDIPSKRNRT
jgi:hypothetical protein